MPITKKITSQALGRMQTRAMKRAAEKYELARLDPTKFVHFQKLPNELRDMVWTFARPGGRIIPLKPRSKRHLRLSVRSSLKQRGLYSPAKVPPILHACRESRGVAQRWYKLSFGTTLYGTPQTYFDQERDEVLVTCNGRNKGQCDGTAITWLLPWEEFGSRRLFVHGEVSRSFLTWQYGACTGITDLVLLPELPLPSVELTKEMLRPLLAGGLLEEGMRERERGIREWCEYTANNSGLGIDRPDFVLETELMEVKA